MIGTVSSERKYINYVPRPLPFPPFAIADIGSYTPARDIIILDAFVDDVTWRVSREAHASAFTEQLHHEKKKNRFSLVR